MSASPTRSRRGATIRGKSRVTIRQLLDFSGRPRARPSAAQQRSRRSRCDRDRAAARRRAGQRIHLRTGRAAGLSRRAEGEASGQSAARISRAARAPPARSRVAALSGRSRGQSPARRRLGVERAAMGEARPASRVNGGVAGRFSGTLRASRRGSSANRAYSLGWWNNRAAPGGREFDFEAALDAEVALAELEQRRHLPRRAAAISSCASARVTSGSTSSRR